MSSTEVRYPDFYVIGAPKCGTTALYVYLSEHKSVFIPKLKEPHFFAGDFDVYRTVNNLNTYAALYKDADDGQLTGDGSVWYLYSEVAVAEILKVRPDAKFIVLLRNPADAAEALHAEQILSLTEDIQDFETAWDAEADRTAGRRVPLHCKEPRHLLYSRVYSYANQLRRLFAQTSPENVKVMIYEEFFQSPEETFTETQAFLGLPIERRTGFERINSGQTPRRLFLHRIMSRPPSLLRPAVLLLARLSQRYGLKLGMLSRKLMRVESVKRRALSPNFCERMANVFGPDIAEVEALLGRPIEAWKPSVGSP